MNDNPGLIEGVVVDTADPQELGRMKVWCPAIDGDSPNIEMLPWVMYITPFAGQAHGYPAGNGGKSIGPVSYGFWAVPKCGATVLIGFLYNDYNQRIYMGSFFQDFGNRSLPNGRNIEGQAPQSDSYDVIEPTSSNLKTQFGGDLANSIAQTRGVYERQVAQAKDDKDEHEGYQVRVVPAGEKEAGDLDPQTYCITTPGRHAIIMHDNPKTARVRIKTAEGHQIILDDANERIYISTSRGNTWIELDVDGHVHIHGGASVSIGAGKDINLSADGNINIAAGGNLNLAAAGYARMSACDDISFSGDAKMNFTTGGLMNLKAGPAIMGSAAAIHLNGEAAEEAECADQPSIIPNHEPWTRPASSAKRNTNWKA
jgi:Type VI secretion system/phage-baseplate injector OB domain